MHLMVTKQKVQRPITLLVSKLHHFITSLSTTMTTNDTNFSGAYQEAHHLMALRRAIAVATVSTEVLMQDYFIEQDIQQYVRLAREHRELGVALRTAEESILVKMGTEMKRKEKVILCYDLLHYGDSEAVVSVSDLANAVEKLDLPLGVDTVTEYFGKSGNELLPPYEVEDYLEHTRLQLNCTFHDLTQLCVVKMAFGQDGRKLLEDMVATFPDSEEPSQLDDEFEKDVIQSRLILTFRMMDFHRTGKA